MPADDAIRYPIATVDAVILTIEDDQVKVLLHRRDRDPFKGDWALPGGFVHVDDDADAEAAMRRVLAEKVGTNGLYLEQLATYSGPTRDPRGWSISITHLALVPREALEFEGRDADVQLAALDALPDLAFDHARIIADARARLVGKGSYSTLPASFLPTEFTLGEMQKAYETVLGTQIDQSSFRRKVGDLDLIEETGESRRDGRRRPAKLFRLREGIGTFDRTLATGLG